MSKLNRGFINAKRLITIGVNANTRELWLMDYLKCIGKSLQSTNNVDNSFEKETRKYVLYNSQNLSLKTFVDDEVDVIGKRSIIQDNTFENWTTYGYTNPAGGYEREIDLTPKVIAGYSTFDGTNPFDYDFTREEIPETAINPPMYGYTVYLDLTALREVSTDIIHDSYEDIIYTSDSAGNEESYKWTREFQVGDRLTILIHNDVFNLLTVNQKNTLLGKIKRYVLAQIVNSVGIEGYE